MLSPPAEIVRRNDPDRFLTALFAPPAKRETLLLLYAFNHELARAREVASEPTLARIRLQWWREIVEGTRRRHEVAEPLGAAIDRGDLPAAGLAALIDAREMEADDSIPTLADWRIYLAGTAGRLAELAGSVLGVPTGEGEPGEDKPVESGLGAFGTAYGIAGLLRSVSAQARRGRCLLPEDVLEAHGLTAEGVVTQPADPALHPVLAALAREGQALLRVGGAARLPRDAVAAALPGVLAQRDLRRLMRRPGAPAGPRGIGDRLAVFIAAMRGRVLVAASRKS
jgi:phytoene synthase